MGGLLALSRGIDRMNTVIGRSAAWLILLAIFVSAINAVIRKVFSISSNAWLELQWYLFGGAFMLASAYTLLQNEHIRIDIFYGRWSRRTQLLVDIVGTLLFLMPFTGLMIWLMYHSMMISYRTNEISMNAGGLTIWPAKAILFVGFVLLFVQGISEVIRKVAILRGVVPDDHAHVSAHEAALREAEIMLGHPHDTEGSAPGASADHKNEERP